MKLLHNHLLCCNREAIIESGAKPVFTGNKSNSKYVSIDLKKKITKKTKAVIVVHMLRSCKFR